MRRKKRGTGIGGIAFGVLFVVLGYQMDRERGEAIRDARPVRAEIVATSVEREEISRPDGGTQITHNPRIRYRYTVNGRTHTGESIWPASSRSGEKAWARDFIAEYPPGSEVRAFYQPDAPGEAFLLKGRPWLPWFAYGMGAVFAALGGATLMARLRRPAR